MSDSYKVKDAGQDTGVSSSEASRAWHQARDDAAASGQLQERNENKVSDSEEGREIYQHLERFQNDYLSKQDK